MTELFLVRHGETEWNVTEVFCGRADIGLSANGFKQAELLAEYLKSRSIEAVYSSPLQRAVKTAEAAAKQLGNLQVTISPGLIDFDCGGWEGLTVPQVKERYPGLFDLWVTHPEKVRFPGGETLDEVTQRVMPVVNEVVKKHRGGVLLVSHRVVLKIIVSALLGLDNSRFWNIKQDTCGMSIFSYDNGRFVLTKHNDTCFLEAQRLLRDF